MTRFTGQEVQTATEVVRCAGELGGQGALRGHIQQAAAITSPAPNAAVPPSPPARSAQSVIDALSGAGPLLRHISPSAAAAAASSLPPPTAVGAIPGLGARAVPLSRPPASIPAFGGGAGTGGGWLAANAARLSAGIDALAATVGTATNALAAPATLSAQAVQGAAAAATPLAHVHPHPPPPTPEPPAARFADPGQVQHEQAPQPPPSSDAPPPRQTPPSGDTPRAQQSPPAQPSTPTPAPVTLATTGVTAPPEPAPTPSTGGGGVQMLGFGPPGLGPAPQAPPLPLPRDPAPPVPPPVPPIEEMTKEQALQAWEQLNNDKANYAARCDPRIVGPLPPGPYSACMREFGELNTREAALRARLGQFGISVADPSAPPPTQPNTPGAQPQQGAPGTQEPPRATGESPPLIDEVPLQTDLRQIEEKYSQHAEDFGVTDPRGRAGFGNFDRALKQFVDDPATMHIQGTFRGQPAILNYNPDSGLCVIQKPDGTFISGWKLSPEQTHNVLTRGSL